MIRFVPPSILVLLLVLGLTIGTTLLPTGAAHAAESVAILAAPGEPPRLQVLSSDDRGIRLVVELPELATEDVVEAGRNRTLASIPGGGFDGRPGEPAIPTFARLIAVPPGASVRVRAVSLEQEERVGTRLATMPAPGEREFGPEHRAAAAGGAVADAAAPAPAAGHSLVRMGTPAVLRDLVVVDLTFRPVAHDPERGTLTITRRMEVEIDFVAGDSSPDHPTPRPTLQPSIPPSFDRLYRELVLNYEGPSHGRRQSAHGSFRRRRAGSVRRRRAVALFRAVWAWRVLDTAGVFHSPMVRSVTSGTCE